jgi:hypothetical protein
MMMIERARSRGGDCRKPQRLSSTIPSVFNYAVESRAERCAAALPILRRLLPVAVFGSFLFYRRQSGIQ